MFFHLLLVASWMIGMPAGPQTKTKEPPPPVRIRMSEAPPPAEVFAPAERGRGRTGRQSPWAVQALGDVFPRPGAGARPARSGPAADHSLAAAACTTATPASVIPNAAALARLAAVPPLNLNGPQQTPALRSPQKKRTDTPEAIDVPAPRREVAASAGADPRRVAPRPSAGQAGFARSPPRDSGGSAGQPASAAAVATRGFARRQPGRAAIAAASAGGCRPARRP